MKTGITPTPIPPEVMAEKENAKDLTSGCKRIRIKAQPTHATFQHNILQHCCAQRTAYSWPPCNNMLQQVGWYWIKFENGQIFVATFLDVARWCTRFASPFTTSHNTIQQCCKMLRWNVVCVCWAFQYKKTRAHDNFKIHLSPSFVTV